MADGSRIRRLSDLLLLLVRQGAPGVMLRADPRGDFYVNWPGDTSPNSIDAT
jgi:hypothetical protein